MTRRSPSASPPTTRRPGAARTTTLALQPPDLNSVYGTYALRPVGVLRGAGELRRLGQLGIHGTNDDAPIGTEVSHGCIRMHNADIEQPVPVLPSASPSPSSDPACAGGPEGSAQGGEPRLDGGGDDGGSWPSGRGGLRARPWVTGPGMAARCWANSSGVLNGSRARENRQGRSSCGRCSIRSLRLARRVQRVRDETRPAAGIPSATAIEQMRPPVGAPAEDEPRRRRPRGRRRPRPLPPG